MNLTHLKCMLLFSIFSFLYISSHSLVSGNANFKFRRVDQEDLPLLYSWFEKPHVKKWWPIPNEGEDFFDFFLKRIRSTEICPFIVLLNDKPIGYIQSYSVNASKSSWLPTLPANTIGVDQFIGEEQLIGKGLGVLFIKAFIEFIEAKKNDITIILDPDPDNVAAIRCYEKIGFIKMGEQQAPHGPVLVMRFSP